MEIQESWISKNKTDNNNIFYKSLFMKHNNYTVANIYYVISTTIKREQKQHKEHLITTMDNME